jgi:hypothetical protein
VDDELDELDDEDVDDDVVLVVLDVEDTVMARSGCLRRAIRAAKRLLAGFRFKKIVREMKRTARLIQAGIIRVEAFDCSAEFAAHEVRRAIDRARCSESTQPTLTVTLRCSRKRASKGDSPAASRRAAHPSRRACARTSATNARPFAQA